MSQITSFPLTHLSVITITGKDAIKFLQGQGTQDFTKLEEHKWLSGAFCTAKGRAVTNVLICPELVEPKPTDESKPTDSDEALCVHLICHQSSVEPLLKHLLKYAAFFRGTQLLNNAQRYQLVGLSGDQITTELQKWTSQHQSLLPYGQLKDGRFIFILDTLNPDFDARLEKLQSIPALDNSDWQTLDIQNSVLWLNCDQVEQWIPQHFNLDQVDGISFNKGCYTGQEVVARLHFKGQSKKRLFALKWPENHDINAVKLYQGDKIVGDVVQQVTSQGYRWALAILKTNCVQEKIYLDESQQLAVELLD